MRCDCDPNMLTTSDAGSAHAWTATHRTGLLRQRQTRRASRSSAPIVLGPLPVVGIDLTVECIQRTAAAAVVGEERVLVDQIGYAWSKVDRLGAKQLAQQRGVLNDRRREDFAAPRRPQELSRPGIVAPHSFRDERRVNDDIVERVQQVVRQLFGIVEVIKHERRMACERHIVVEEPAALHHGGVGIDHGEEDTGRREKGDSVALRLHLIHDGLDGLLTEPVLIQRWLLHCFVEEGAGHDAGFVAGKHRTTALGLAVPHLFLQ
mmetsp:Transcript_49625/g.124448  ORF Transcript_49625/g.124448 Transcript_49625/m.124448 type:complete len:263 (+) Transcript_49625:869-1657(+)